MTYSNQSSNILNTCESLRNSYINLGDSAAEIFSVAASHTRAVTFVRRPEKGDT